jgi:LemA protein
MANIGVIVVAIFAALVLLIGATAWSTHNGLETKHLDAEKAHSNIDKELQRQYELIPNMVTVAETSIKFQEQLPVGYAQAREGLKNANESYQQAIANSSNVDTAKAMRALNDAQTSFTVIARSEAIPKADTTQLTELNNEMTALQNVISYQRGLYNDAVESYNRMLVVWPSSWFAGMWGYEKMDFFQAETAAQKMPSAKMNI